MTDLETALADGFEEQMLLLRRNADGSVTATQPGLDLEGRGENAGRAVEHFGSLVAMAHFERPESNSSEKSSGSPTGVGADD